MYIVTDGPCGKGRSPCFGRDCECIDKEERQRKDISDLGERNQHGSQGSLRRRSRDSENIAAMNRTDFKRMITTESSPPSMKILLIDTEKLFVYRAVSRSFLLM